MYRRSRIRVSRFRDALRRVGSAPTHHVAACRTCRTRLGVKAGIHPRMKSNELEPDDFVLPGNYPPTEAAKLLERFHEVEIAFRTQPRTPPPEPGPMILIDISVDSTRVSEVAQIHRDLFGDGPPNYHSSFFPENRDV